MLKPILKESVTSESCNAVHYLRGMLLYDFMVGCDLYRWKGNLTLCSSLTLSCAVTLFSWSKPILVTTTEIYHLLLYAG